MDRRKFVGACAGAALGTAASGVLAPAFKAAPTVPDANSVPFHFSVMLWTIFRNLPFEQRLEKVAEAGYHAAELVGEFKDWSKAEFAQVRKKKNELGIAFDATTGVSRNFCDPAQRDALLAEFRAALSILEELECHQLIVLTGNKVPGLSHEQMHGNCVEALKHAADIISGKKVEILLENIDPEENPNYFLTSVAEGFDIVREVGNPQVKFLYDFFHEQISEGNLIAKLQKNIDLVGLVHVADVPGRHEPGTGEINYGSIFRKLGELGYNRYVAMEFLPVGEPVAALREAREMAMKLGSAGQKKAATQPPLRRPYAAA